VCSSDLKFSVLNNELDFSPHKNLLGLKPAEWHELTEETFKKVFKNSAVKRTKFSGLKRNINFLKSL
jgi:epoxyqueuosine reductase